MKDKEHYLIRRPDNLPQRPLYPQTFLDRFFDILEQRTFSIALPDFLIPQIDIYESSSAVTLEIEIPGMALQDFVYRVDGDIVHIKGEKRKLKNPLDGAYRRMERRYGLFERVLRLPAEVDDHPSNTTYENGILKLTLAKKISVESQQD
jgi:HSP20 family protein